MGVLCKSPVERGHAETARVSLGLAMTQPALNNIRAPILPVLVSWYRQIYLHTKSGYESIPKP